MDGGINASCKGGSVDVVSDKEWWIRYAVQLGAITTISSMDFFVPLDKGGLAW